MDGKHKEPGPGSWIGAAVQGLVPVGVAAAVAIAIGAGVDVVHRHQKSGEKERSARPAAEQDRTAPRHVVAIREPGNALVVRDVRTGNDVGLAVASPAGQRFQRVAAAGDGTFVVAAAGAGKVTFQRLRLGEDGGPAELTPLPKAVVTGTSTAWSDLAVAPDGDRIAYVTYRPGGLGRLEVVSASTGERKTWTTTTPARVSSLSWAGSTLGFVWSPTRRVGGRIVHQVRTIDTASAPSGDLKTSKAVLKLPDGSGGAAVLGKDGRTVVAGVAKDAQLTVQSFAAGTGGPGGVLWRQKAAGQAKSVTADHAGEHFLVLAGDGRLLIDGAAPLPAEDVLDAAW